MSITALGLVVAIFIFGFEDFSSWFQKIFLDLLLAIIVGIVVDRV